MLSDEPDEMAKQLIELKIGMTEQALFDLLGEPVVKWGGSDARSMLPGGVVLGRLPNRAEES
jgi:hypothetical protein